MNAEMEISKNSGDQQGGLACHIWSYITQLTSLSDGSAFAFLKSVGSRRKRISIKRNILSDNIFDFILSPLLTLDPSENQSFPKILRRFYLFSKYLWKMPSLIQKVANLWKENKKHYKMIYKTNWYEIPKFLSPALLMSCSSDPTTNCETTNSNFLTN